MRYLIALAPLALLAACGGNKATNNSAAKAPAANTAAPAPAPAPTPTAPPATPAPDPAALLNECATEVAKQIPEGADAAGLCTCAVQKVQAGQTEEQATLSCAAELDIEFKAD